MIMKQQIIALASLALLASCAKNESKVPEPAPTDYKCEACLNAPEAKQVFDASSAGVYKGVLAGAAGNIAFYIRNGDTNVYAKLNLDGKSTVLQSTWFSTWQTGKKIWHSGFTGTLDGQAVQAEFSVDSNGANPELVIWVPGKNIQVGLHKETSATQVKCFEGTFTGDREGSLGVSVHGDVFAAVMNLHVGVVKDTVGGGKIQGVHEGMEITGEVKGDMANGTWRDLYTNIQGKWTAKRTL